MFGSVGWHWKVRHENVLSQNSSNFPANLMVINSIESPKLFAKTTRRKSSSLCFCPTLHSLFSALYWCFALFSLPLCLTAYYYTLRDLLLLLDLQT